MGEYSVADQAGAIRCLIENIRLADQVGRAVYAARSVSFQSLKDVHVDGFNRLYDDHRVTADRLQKVVQALATVGLVRMIDTPIIVIESNVTLGQYEGVLDLLRKYYKRIVMNPGPFHKEPEYVPYYYDQIRWWGATDTVPDTENGWTEKRVEVCHVDRVLFGIGEEMTRAGILIREDGSVCGWSLVGESVSRETPLTDQFKAVHANAVRDLGEDLGGFSVVDLMADKFPELKLEVIRETLIEAGLFPDEHDAACGCDRCDPPDEPEEPESGVIHRTEVWSQPDGSLEGEEYTNDNLDQGYPTETASWPVTFKNLDQFMKKYRSKSPYFGCAGGRVEVLVDGEHYDPVAFSNRPDDGKRVDSKGS